MLIELNRTAMDIQQYIKSTTGLPVQMSAISPKDMAALPLFLRKSRLQLLTIHNREVVVHFVNVPENVLPDRIQKQSTLLEQHFGMPVVFVFEQMDAYLRKRLIQRNISFIVAGKQMFIPALFIDFREYKSFIVNKRITLSPATQCILLYHLLINSLEGRDMRSLKPIFGYSAMTISRAIAELKKCALCQTAVGKVKIIHFPLASKELWTKAIPFLSSPVVVKVYAETANVKPFYVSGETGLAFYSNLTGDGQKTIAMFGPELIKAGISKKNEDFNQNGGEICIEKWSYNPGILTNSNTVDPLSLYLSLADSKDERVILALQDMMENIRW